MDNRRGKNSELVKSTLNEFSPQDERKIITKMEISIRIEEARKKKGWSKLDLAKQFNQKPSVITKWLSGSHNFTIDTLVDIEEVLNINVISIEENQEKSDVQFTSVTDGISIAPGQINQYCYDILLGIDPTYSKEFRSKSLSRA